MSSYFDCCIERKRENGKWTLITESTYTDLDVIDPYVLKGVFWDTDHYQKLACIDDDFSQKTTLSLGSKIEKSDSFSSWYSKTNKEDISYPYKYEKRMKPYVCNPFNVLDVLNCIQQTVSVKWNELWVPFSKEFINANFREFSNYFEFNTDMSDQDVGTNIDFCLDLVKNFKVLDPKRQDTVYMYFSSANTAIQSLKYHLLKNESDTTQLSAPILVVEYLRKDEKGNEIIVPQYEFNNVKISNLDDIQSMIKDVQKSLKNYETQVIVENLAKTFINDNILAEASAADLETQLGKDLKSFVGDADVQEDDDYKESLETELKELEVLARLVGNNGRLIWRIS